MEIEEDEEEYALIIDIKDREEEKPSRKRVRTKKVSFDLIILINRNHHQSIPSTLLDYCYRRARIQDDDVEAKVENMITKAKAVKRTKELTPIQLVDRAVQVFFYHSIPYQLGF